MRYWRITTSLCLKSSDYPTHNLVVVVALDTVHMVIVAAHMTVVDTVHTAVVGIAVAHTIVVDTAHTVAVVAVDRAAVRRLFPVVLPVFLVLRRCRLAW